KTDALPSCATSRDGLYLTTAESADAPRVGARPADARHFTSVGRRTAVRGEFRPDAWRVTGSGRAAPDVEPRRRSRKTPAIGVLIYMTGRLGGGGVPRRGS